MSEQGLKNEIVKLAVLQQLVLETMDNVKGTEYYAREVKQQMKKLETTLERKYGALTALLYSADEMSMIGLARAGHSIVEAIAKRDIYTLAEVASIINSMDEKTAELCAPCTMPKLMIA